MNTVPKCRTGSIFSLSGVIPGMFFALMLVMDDAVAACKYPQSFTPKSFTVPLGGTVNVPRDAAVGTELKRFTWTLGTSTAFMTCLGEPVQLRRLLPVTPHLPAMDNIYSTNIPGIGVKITGNRWGVFPGESSFISNSVTEYFWPADTTLSYVFIVTGPVVGSGTVTAVDVPTAQTAFDANPYFNFQATGSVKFATLACRTPSVSVEMGTATQHDFGGVGSTARPVAFTLSAADCPGGLAKISYQLNAPSGILDESAGVIALSKDSTARGIALKVMDDNDKPFKFDTFHTIATNPASGTYTVPLKAAYYRSGQSMSSGTANAILTFTMSYQ
ncbi:type 1 fimbrial protein [Burkholderia arboris]|uniref:fimbrial protein n=1 Tax=Burkholderia arboris TaxID=488730 RepID=UPI001CF347F1|nr:fimbrial protein [Burkholderia arboris]MCA8034435.1 type 1 fimbrial protein [Burkholderia arboris]